MKNLLFSSALLFSVLYVNALTIVGYDTIPFCNFNNSPGGYCPVVTGGTPPYTYMWSNGSTAQCVYGNWPGIYSLTVVDGTNATVAATFTIPSTPSNFTVHVKTNFIPETCSDADGKIWFEITGGTPPYSIQLYDYTNYVYNFTNHTDTLTNLSSRDYFFSIIDANGCVGIDTQSFIFQTGAIGTWGFNLPKDLPYSYTISKTDHNCPQLGSAAVHATGGVPPILYEWNTIPPQFTDSVGGLTSGNYSVTISDGTAGCSVTETVFIANLNPLNASTTSTPELCNFSNGTATIVAQTGTPPYTYLWNTTPVQTTATATNLSQGNYSVTVSDANLCSAVRNRSVGYTSPVQPNPVATHEVCGDGSGSVTLTPTLGTPPYSYQWSNGGSANAITNLNQGNYSFTLDDAQGCSVIGVSQVRNVPPFNANITAVSQTCLSLGSATANVTGTTGPYTYLWNTNPPQNTATATGLSSGTYRCTITDNDGCTSVQSVSVQYDPMVQANLSPVKALCLSATGSVNCTVTGTGQPPYTFVWSNAATTQNITNVPKGNYTVTITDANNCSIVKSAYVQSYTNMSLSISHTNASCIFNNDGEATVNVSNGTPPYTYRWANGQTTQTAAGLTPTWQYGVTVVDANGCTATRCSNRIGYNNLNCAVQVHGKVVNDGDADCAFTPGDAGMLNIPVSCVPGYYAMTNAAGNYHFIIPPGNYAVNHTPPYHMFQLCPQGTVELFGMTGGTDTLVNFFDTVRTALDLSIGYGYLEVPRPGFTHKISVSYANKGNLTSSPIIEYEYDEHVTFMSATHSNYTHDVANRTLSFSFAAMAPGALGRFEMLFYTPDTTALGTRLVECARIFPVQNDVNFIDNVECDSITVVGSYDPNDKRVTPEGFGAEGYISTEDSVLRYHIRFQNTGTYLAENVAILDTLPDYLDPATIERIVASHDFRAEFFLNKYLVFYFDNIMLPDSFSNEPESHGFVSFYIKQKPALLPGTEIENRAAIYFDFNEPIITNMVLNTIIDPTGIRHSENIKHEILVYPNPSNNMVYFVPKHKQVALLKIELFDLSGRMMLVSEKENAVNISRLSQGMYIYRVQDEEGVMYQGKIFKE